MGCPHIYVYIYIYILYVYFPKTIISLYFMRDPHKSMGSNPPFCHKTFYLREPQNSLNYYFVVFPQVPLIKVCKSHMQKYLSLEVNPPPKHTQYPKTDNFIPRREDGEQTPRGSINVLKVYFAILSFKS